VTPHGGKARKKRLHLGRKFWISFLAACLVVIGAEAFLDHTVDAGELPGLTQGIFNLARLYQGLVGADRKPLERFTAVVKIDSDTDPGAIGSTDVCGQREQIAQMVCQIHRASPRVIVIDKFYGTKECGKPNDDLQRAFFEVSQDVPIVLGRLVADENSNGESEYRYYLTPSLQFATVAGAKLAFGVVNIDRDSRKLPLQWQLYPNKESAQAGTSLQLYDTLALAAAKAYDDNLLINHPRLDYLFNHHEHPYISFLREDEFHPITVSEVLAGSEVSGGANATGEQKTFCPTEKPAKNLQKMGGMVVVIGEQSMSDMHQSVVGRLPGYLMQANFIEALLDDRYYRAMPVLDYAYGFLFLAVLELILILFRAQWIKIAFFTAVLLLASVGVLWLTVKLLHWYVNPVPVGLAAVAVRIGGVLFHRAEEEAST
jgi:CHASE2 domain-containing sensor protein